MSADSQPEGPAGAADAPPTQGKRVSGKFWKTNRTAATRRTQMSSGLRTAWETRQQARLEQTALKQRLREMKDETAQAKERAREITKARKQAAAEKERLAKLQAVLSTKQLERPGVMQLVLISIYKI
ncbi:Cgr1 family-domain-containing protein [Dimargaris cristalligena]|uniref:rRNA-processing protein n=1 Tax=Dimargaris cristalligena TaxID=215637 RepID=A0A4P9ZZD1_9FUNG|nr:Cgr1 family-domain-containing protein [Dimargaris cristalligena]|eukprot:RKP38322.1 Cgr1 family-domain-containing protein [Dimargaris cristalligena]